MLELNVNLDEFVLEDVINEYKPIVKECLNGSNAKDIVFEAVEEVKQELDGKMDISEIITLAELRNRRTKSRWIDRDVKEGGGLYQEVQVVARGLYNGPNGVENFRKLYDTDTPESYKEFVIASLEEWRVNSDALLSRYRYIKNKKEYQIRSAIINDIKYALLKSIASDSQDSQLKEVVGLPEVLSLFPYDYSNKALINLEDAEIIDIEASGQNKRYYQDMIKVNDTMELTTLIDADVLQYLTLNAAIKKLNELDMSIVVALLSIAGAEFYSLREVNTSIGNLVRLCFKGIGMKNYMAIKESLNKMAYITSGITDSNLKTTTVKILDKIRIYKENDTEMVTVWFSNDIVWQTVNSKTIRMYRDVIDSFKVKASKILIYKLQSLRVSLSLEDDSPLTMRVDMGFFRGALSFNDKRTNRNIKVVEEALDEIIRHNITLKSYKRTKESFLLEFHPISQREKIDLLHTPINAKKVLPQ